MNWHSRPLTALAATLLLLTAGCAGLPIADTNADEIAEQVQDRHDEIEDMQGVMTTETEIDGDTQRTTMAFWERPPDRYRTEVIESTGAGSSSDVTVFDGNTSWHYDTEANEVTRFETDTDTAAAEFDIDESEVIESILEDYDVEYTGDETVGDRETYVLELTPTDEESEPALGYDALTLWVDQEYWYPIKQHAELSTGEETIAVTTTYEEIAFNEGIDDDRFEFEPPEDAEIVDAEMPDTRQFDDLEEAAAAVPFDVAEPTVPDEYAVESVTTSEYDDTTTLSATYESEASDDSLFVTITDGDATADGESIDVGDREGVLVDSFATTMIEWECDGLVYSVSGEHDAEDLVSIGETVDCA